MCRQQTSTRSSSISTSRPIRMRLLAQIHIPVCACVCVCVFFLLAFARVATNSNAFHVRQPEAHVWYVTHTKCVCIYKGIRGRRGGEEKKTNNHTGNCMVHKHAQHTQPMHTNRINTGIRDKATNCCARRWWLMGFFAGADRPVGVESSHSIRQHVR